MIGMPIPGFVPYVIIGSSASASMVIDRSNVAPSSVGSPRQRSTAASQSAPCGACGRPWTYSNVVSSGAMRPARAPPSMLMLQTVIRCSMVSARMASPRYSNTWPVPPPTPIRAISARMMSLAETPGASRPSTRTSYVLGLRCSRACVASTISTSLVPMPNASAPKAPCVEVCESPHTIVMPGWVSPSCGPITCTMPCDGDPMPCSGIPKSAQLRSSWLICAAACASSIGSERGVVGIE